MKEWMLEEKWREMEKWEYDWIQMENMKMLEEKERKLWMEEEWIEWEKEILWKEKELQHQWEQ